MKFLSAFTLFFFWNLLQPAWTPAPTEPLPDCGTDWLHQHRMDHSPEYQSKVQKLEKKWQDHVASGVEKNLALYTLPVVVHIIHQNGAENITDATAQQAIDQMNDAFANINYYDQDTGVDTQVEFCLAKRDPDGSATTGINRVVSPLTDMIMETEDLQVKDLIRWNPLEYINIWVVREICSQSIGCGVAGYAYFPSSHGDPEDGILLEANYMGSSPANTGVLIHEMGHYLGLYHTFQGGCGNNDCTQDGDRVCDTPPDNSTAPVPCGADVNSCTTDTQSGFPTDQDDMYINYMDYGDLDCYSAFSQGQADRMDFFINGTRSSLLDSPACLDPCLIPITADFTPSTTVVNAGGTVTFVNNSTGATTYDWQIDGVNFASTQNAAFTFNTEGVFEVTLITSNSDVNCQGVATVMIEVTCPVTATFQSSSNVVSPGTVVYFTNFSTNATDYEWYLDGVLSSTDQNWNNLFENLGNFDVQLVATDGFCSDTSAVNVVTVSTNGLSQTGLPVWPMSSGGGGEIHEVNWQSIPPDVNIITNNAGTQNPGATGAAFDGCADLVFYVVHNGSSDPENLFIYAPDGTPLLTNSTPNAPGLNSVRGGHEIQVVRVPGESDEWYILYQEWSSDIGSPISNAAYNPARILFSRVSYSNGVLDVIDRDIPLLDNNGVGQTYNDGMAVSRTAAGNPNAHYLYATRNTVFSNSVSVDRYLIEDTGISFSANTGPVSVNYWNLTHAGSHVELSPTEDRIAVGTRNQFNNWQDYLIFDALAFSNASVQVLSCNDLILVADGTANDQSSVLPYSASVEAVSNDNSLPLQFLGNFERKLSRHEFSPNGRFLYITGGGYNSGGFTNLTYLAQIDLEASPLEVRIQVQTTPNNTYNAFSGVGCQTSSGACLDAYRSIGNVETSYDGNLYFTKRNDPTLYVIPDPNNIMPQNLVPSDIDLSTPDEPNILTTLPIVSIPDPIDGFNYFLSEFDEVEIVVNALDCDGNCLAPYELQITSLDGEILESYMTDACPDTLLFCADTAGIYNLVNPVSGVVYDSAIVALEVQYPEGEEWFDFSDLVGCVEICGNGIDDDNDGLIDCDDPDLVNDCCCQNPLTLDLGPDQEVCENGTVTLDAGPGFDTYLWPDFTSDQTFTAYGPGTYWVTTTDTCGLMYSDTMIVTLDQASILDLGPDITICESGDNSVTLTATGFDEYQWIPDTFLDCNNCPTVVSNPDSTITYVVVGNTSDGCYSVDTITVEVLDTSFTVIDTTVCAGGTVVFDGQELDINTSTTFTYANAVNCDSIIQVNVIWNGEAPSMDTLEIPACEDSFITFGGVDIDAGEEQLFTYSSQAGCDSSILVVVPELPTYLFEETVEICEGESAFIFGNEETAAGEYTLELMTAAGCDSIFEVTLVVHELPGISVQTTPTCIDVATGTINVTVTGGQTPYDYTWEPLAANTGQLVGLEAGIYSLTVTDNNGCEVSEEIEVEETLPPAFFVEAFSVDCFDDVDGEILIQSPDTTLSFSLDGVQYTKDTLFESIAPGNYTVYVQDIFGCIYTEETSIFAASELNVTLPPDTTILFGETVMIPSFVNTTQPVSYTWFPSESLDCTTCPLPTAQPPETTQYTLVVEDDLGCQALDSIIVFVDQEKRVYIPNAFTPNFDGFNDYFQVFTGPGVNNLVRMNIFDRWGELIYEVTDVDPNANDYGWDGTFRGQRMNSGIYVYFIELEFFSGERRIYEGGIHLVR
jgi:gliding motility-associated-like protein